MTEKAAPTITLAQLYESQNQLIYALVIYKKIHGLDQTKDLILKIEEMQNLIFGGNQEDYPDQVKLLFSLEERKQFNILPHHQAKTYRDALMQANSTPPAMDVPLDEKAEATNDVQNDIHNENVNNEVLSFLESLKNADLSSIKDETRDKHLQDLTLAEIKELLEKIDENEKNQE